MSWQVAPNCSCLHGGRGGADGSQGAVRMCKGILTPLRGPTIVGIPFVLVLTSSVWQWRPLCANTAWLKVRHPEPFWRHFRACLTPSPSLSDVASEHFRCHSHGHPRITKILMNFVWLSLCTSFIFVTAEIERGVLIVIVSLPPAAIVINNNRKLIFFFYQSSILKRWLTDAVFRKFHPHLPPSALFIKTYEEVQKHIKQDDLIYF